MSDNTGSLNNDEIEGLTEVNKSNNILLAPFILFSNAILYKELLVNFVKRDLRQQYRDSILGYIWTLVEPLLLTIIYYIFFAILVQKPEEAYAFWVIIGVIVWGLFTKTMTAAVSSLYTNRNMLQSIYLPRELFPLGKASSQAVISLLSIIIAIPFMVFFEQPLNVNILLVPIGLLLAYSLGLGLGMLLAPFNVITTDVSHFVRIILRAGFFLSPVMWTLDMIASRGTYAEYVLYNPMVVPITMVRNGFRGIPLGVETGPIIYSVCFCLFAFIIGSIIFKRFESRVVKFL